MLLALHKALFAKCVISLAKIAVFLLNLIAQVVIKMLQITEMKMFLMIINVYVYQHFSIMIKYNVNHALIIV